jgi:hypothetical protein
MGFSVPGWYEFRTSAGGSAGAPLLSLWAHGLLSLSYTITSFILFARTVYSQPISYPFLQVNLIYTSLDMCTDSKSYTRLWGLRAILEAFNDGRTVLVSASLLVWLYRSAVVSCSNTYTCFYGWTGHKTGSGFSDLAPSILY